MAHGALAALALTVAHVQAQIQRTDAFGNQFNIVSGSGGSYMSPFSPGNIVSFPTSKFLKACTNCTRYDVNSTLVTTPIGFSNDVPRATQWTIVDSSSVVPDTYALKNLQTGLFLGRCTTPGCKRISKANPGIYPLVISEQTPSKTSIWALSNAPTQLNGPYQYLLSGGKGLFLGRAKFQVYPSNASEPQYVLFQTNLTSISVNNLARLFPQGTVVINDVAVIFDAYA